MTDQKEISAIPHLPANGAGRYGALSGLWSLKLLRPGVGFVVDLLQLGGGELGVALRGGEALVPE